MNVVEAKRLNEVEKSPSVLLNKAELDRDQKKANVMRIFSHYKSLFGEANPIRTVADKAELYQLEETFCDERTKRRGVKIGTMGGLCSQLR